MPPLRVGQRAGALLERLSAPATKARGRSVAEPARATDHRELPSERFCATRARQASVSSARIANARATRSAKSATGGAGVEGTAPLTRRPPTEPDERASCAAPGCPEC